MLPRRDYVRRNQNVEQQAPPAFVDSFCEIVTRAEFSDNFQVLGQAIIAQSNREVVSIMNTNISTTTTRDLDFTRMNLQNFMVE